MLNWSIEEIKYEIKNGILDDLHYKELVLQRIYKIIEDLEEENVKLEDEVYSLENEVSNLEDTIRDLERANEKLREKAIELREEVMELTPLP